MRRLLVALAAAAWGAAWAADVSFQRLDLGGNAEHGIFAEDLDGDGLRDLIALSRGRISIYRARRGAVPLYSDLPETLLTGSLGYFADVADVLPAPGKELLVLTPTGVAVFQHKDGRYEPRAQMLLRCDTLLTSRPVAGAVAATLRPNQKVLPWNFAFDANGDGLDDILVPHGNGTDVYLQTKPGDFAKPVTLLLFPLVYHNTAAQGRANYLGGKKALPINIELVVRTIEARDINGDGKPDLVCADLWFAQKLDRTFDPVPALVPPELIGATEPNDFVQFVDVNGDGRKDRIEAQHSFEDPLNILTNVRYFLAGPNGELPETPTDTIRGPNILVHTPLPVHDFNGDGALDFVMFQTDLSVTEIAKWIRQAFGKIDGKLNFYLFDKEADRYPRRPSVSKDIHIEFKVDLMDAIQGLVWMRFLGTMMRFEGDFNADGKADLMVRRENTTLSLYLNKGGRYIYGSRPDLEITDTPMFGGLELDDLNGDGATDLILYGAIDPYAPASNYGHVIAVYISQLQ